MTLTDRQQQALRILERTGDAMRATMRNSPEYLLGLLEGGAALEPGSAPALEPTSSGAGATATSGLWARTAAKFADRLGEQEPAGAADA